MRDAGERLHQLGAPGAHQPVKAENFPFAQAEADMGKLGRVTEVFTSSTVSPGSQSTFG
jgi:hypothetical protein